MKGLLNPKGNHRYKIYDVRGRLLHVAPYLHLVHEFASEYLDEDIKGFQEDVLLRGHLMIRVQRD